MSKSITTIICILSIVHFVSAQKKVSNEWLISDLTENVFHLSEVMLHDVASPPAASRFYAYSLLGAYEVVAESNNTFPDISQQFHTKPKFTLPSKPADLYLPFCANYAMLEVGRNIMPSGFQLEAKQKELIAKYQKKLKLSQTQINSNKTYAEAVAMQVLAYAKSDGYNKLSTYKRYTPNKEEGHWYPTPPEYMAPVEPYWPTVRSFFIDSSKHYFNPARPASFSKEPQSSFYTLMKEVYDVTKTMTSEQRQIAAFWDCNPFAVSYSGHMAIGLKKISPGGHWMGISGIVCKQKQVPVDSAILIHTMVALTLHDAFICCWKEKYTSDRIRPETAINKYIDPAWRPMLQTPPFPEYTSGHSVVSAASAEILSYFIGDSFRFTDTSEEYFGLPPRNFTSFRHASSEAGISRLYGGIHFRDSIEEGQKQGNKIGKFVLSKLVQ
ncbi:vanadium-dependent haloperoxidase [Cytophagaceae bacterium YF14B1]|uniref:Vanadium-dependent haloperoxidase n=1 Tax=Xanthocytophaga flava TaxID=3048013 RepID=A0AAE3QRR2_9BACT|nr:vanadium-dependent haloperoxidase [Xanthocytophaga flavus]MDJ1483726.1 vanadium-dependent haloperoxidase [Xanthocytophaga flavus]